MSEFNRYLERAYMEEVPNTLKRYAFDWDDNIQNLSTTINLKNPDGEIVERVSTGDFAHKRNDPQIKELLSQGYTWDYSAFRDDAQFDVDSNEAIMKVDENGVPTGFGPAWDDFVECLNSASLFSIITARGHSVDAYKKTIKGFINQNINGIDKQLVIQNINDYIEKSGENIGIYDDDALIDYYLNLNQYYPVNNDSVKASLGGEGAVDSPEELKTKAFSKFHDYSQEQTSKIPGVDQTIGFSDDDKRNIDVMKDHIAKQGYKSTVKYTGK